MANEPKCECDQDADVPDDEDFLKNFDPVLERPFMGHKKGECKCTHRLMRYLRKSGQIIWLCSMCYGTEPELPLNQ